MRFLKRKRFWSFTVVAQQWGEFSGIEPNPQYDTLMQAVTVIREQGYDYLLAVGFILPMSLGTY